MLIKQLQMSSALLKLTRALKALLLQYTVVEKNNMVETRKLLQTFGFASMTSSVVQKAPNAHGYSIGLRYMIFGLF